MATNAIYHLFPIGKGKKFTVVQVRSVATGKLIHAADATCYSVLVAVETPWWGLKIDKGSRMILADDAAAPLLASGRIEPVSSQTLISWRAGFEAAAAARKAKKKDLAGRTGVL